MIWLDAHLSPILAVWLKEDLGVDAVPLRALGLREARDGEIFQAARQAAVVFMTKDADFLNLLVAQGPPPSVVWLTCGNCSSAALRLLLRQTLPQALALIAQGESLVEIC